MGEPNLMEVVRMPVPLIVVVVSVVLIVVGIALPREVRLYRRARHRRGGVLELDTPEARAAIADDPDDWFRLPIIVDPGVPQGTVGVRVTALRRCNPQRKTHFHGAGDRCECGERPNVLPFAGGDAA